MKVKASFTVEAALLCPVLCLVLCGMILFTLQLYGTVDSFVRELTERQVFFSSDLIRLEAVAEDTF